MPMTYLVTILFWLPPTVVILYNLIWDTRFWQAKEYQLSRIASVVRYDFEPSHRKRLTLYLKVAIFFLISYFFIDNKSLIPAVGIVALYGLWIHNSLTVFENLQLGQFPHVRINIRNISIWLLGIVGMAIIPIFLSIPLFLNRFSNFESYEAFGVLPQTTSFGNVLVPDFYIYLVFSALLALTYDLASPIITILAVIFSKPVEWLLEYMEVAKARNNLALHPNLVVVAVTGSRGKSTVKNLIKDILGKDFEVAVTAEDETNLTKVARAINRNLKLGTEVFVIELNALKEGDIKKIGGLIKPQLAVITGIDETHASLFGSMEKTLEVKREILELLPDSGTAILNGDDELVAKIAGKTDKKEIFYFTHHDPHRDFVENRLEVDTYLAANHELDRENEILTFDLINQQREIRVRAHSQTNYILSSLLAAIAVCNELGLDLGKIADRVIHVTHTSPPFDIMDGDNETKLVIDAKPVNIAKLENFIRLASEMTEGRKILVTTGVHELGKYKSKVYKRLHDEIYDNIDIVMSYDPHLLESLSVNNSKLELVHIKNRLELLYLLRTRTDRGDNILIVGDIDPWVIAELRSEE